MSDSPSQSRRVNDGPLKEEQLLWTNMLSMEYPEHAGETYAAVCSALRLFCKVFEQREVRVADVEVAAAARRGGLPPGEPQNTALQSPHGHDATLHAIVPTNDTSNDDKVVTADAITLDRFWELLLASWKKKEKKWDPANTFDKARTLLQRRKEMARQGIVELDLLLEMLISEYGEDHAHLFPAMLTPRQWYQLLDEFSREDCQILFLLDFDYHRKAHPQAS
ncbi:hypothetical protein E4U15_002375 [Claviceps sp. LM218 group G6]|nr:hypothetical protein E4U15_002375 [Claviceps sp. LM218 group G6]KAG6106389.1 hypothetical protein E4U14_004620 [Claviceps sp. LM454 group G7]